MASRTLHNFNILSQKQIFETYLNLLIQTGSSRQSSISFQSLTKSTQQNSFAVATGNETWSGSAGMGNRHPKRNNRRNLPTPRSTVSIFVPSISITVIIFRARCDMVLMPPSSSKKTSSSWRSPRALGEDFCAQDRAPLFHVDRFNTYTGHVFR